MKNLLPLLIILLASSCSSPSDNTGTSADAEASLYYPTLPAGHLDSVAALVNQIDYVFYDLPISMSTSEASSIQALLSHYESVSRIARNNACRSIGRIFYVSQGENILSADLFFRDSCRFAVFLKDEQPLFAARINDKGTSFLINAGVPLRAQ